MGKTCQCLLARSVQATCDSKPRSLGGEDELSKTARSFLSTLLAEDCDLRASASEALASEYLRQWTIEDSHASTGVWTSQTSGLSSLSSVHNLDVGLPCER